MALGSRFSAFGNLFVSIVKVSGVPVATISPPALPALGPSQSHGRRLYCIAVVFNDEDAVADIAEFLERVDETFLVARV